MDKKRCYPHYIERFAPIKIKKRINRIRLKNRIRNFDLINGKIGAGFGSEENVCFLSFEIRINRTKTIVSFC